MRDSSEEQDDRRDSERRRDKDPANEQVTIMCFFEKPLQIQQHLTVGNLLGFVWQPHRPH